MLIACHACHRQYDVAHLAAGQRIRCACGELNEIPAPRVREAPVQRCASCGGALAQGATTCGYCDATVTLAERGWGEACPECFARLVKDARFCSACGIAIAPQTIRKSKVNTRCPRCRGELVECELPDGQFTECAGCGGVWLEEGSFEQLSLQQERRSAVASYFSTPDRREAAQRTATAQDGRYLACPVCEQMMNRKNFAKVSGVIIDWCKGHGYWFDAHELERIIAFVARGGLEKARQREIHEQEHQVKLARERARNAAAEAGRAEVALGQGWGAPGGRHSMLTVVFGSLLAGLFD